MSTRRRLLRIAVILLLVIVIGGYGAVSTFLFDPFEGSYEFDVSTLIPRDVEFYLSKEDLEGDFDPFPRLAILDKFEEGRGGRALTQAPFYQDLRQGLDLTPIMEEIDATLAQLPVEVSPLGLFGGRDAAIAGYFQGEDLARSRWAVYGRTNWIGRVAVELLRHPDTIGLTDQGMVVDEVLDGDEVVGHSISGGQLTAMLYVTRVLDVVIISNDPELLKRAVGFDAKRGEDSLGLSAKYGDYIDVVNRTGEDLELYVHQRKMSENMGWSGDWPDAYGESFFTSFWGKLFQVGYVNELVGSCSFGGGLQLRLHGQLSSDKLTKAQKRLYRVRGFDRRTAEKVARLAPDDAGLFFYMHGDVGDLLRTLTASFEEAELGLIEDLVREVWGYPDILPLIDDLDATFRDQFAFIVADHDYPEETGPKTPPHDDTPVLSWAVVLWPKDPVKLEQIETKILRRQGAFRIQGQEPGSQGIWKNEIDGGSRILEYWNVFVPGTGMISTLAVSADDEYFVISNSHQFLNEINSAFFKINETTQQLAQQNFFQSYVLSGLSSSNIALWLNPRAIGKSLREIADFQAGMDVISAIDWKYKRPEILRRLLRENWPNEDPGSVSPEVLPQLELLYEEEAKRYERDFVRENGGTMREDYRRRIEMWEVFECAMLQLAIDPKAIDLVLRVYMPLD